MKTKMVILDEPIPRGVRKRPLKPLPARPQPKPRLNYKRKRKAVEEEFDPIRKIPRTTADYQREILEFRPPNLFKSCTS